MEKIIIDNQKKKNKIPRPKKKNNYSLKDAKILMMKFKERRFSEKNIFSRNKLNNENLSSTSTQTNKETMKGILGNPNLKFRPLSNKLIRKNIYKTYHSIKNKFNPIKIETNNFLTNNEETSFDKELNLNNKNYLSKYFSKYQQSVSLYSVLEKKKNDFFEKIKEKKFNYSFEKKNNKKMIIGLNQVSNKTQKSKDLKIPFLNNNLVTIHSKNFLNYSSGIRYEKNMTKLNRIKQMIISFRKINNDNEENKIYSYKLISNYLMSNGIFEKQFYSQKYINNFENFLKLDYDISPNYVFKKCLYDILNGKYNNYLKGSVTNKSSKREKKKIIKQSKSTNSFIENNLFFQKYFLTSPSLNDIKKNNIDEYMNIIINSTNINLDNMKKNYEEAKKKKKLCEIICYNREKQNIKLKELLNISS